MPTSDKLFVWKVEDCVEDYSNLGNGALPRDDETRKTLPAKARYKHLKLTSVVKSMIGKDLTRVTLPLTVNEPLSMLQRLAESLEYAYLLDKADLADDPVLRIELVTAFGIACLSSSKDRTLKPFNPLLGETYQLEKPGYRLLAEQVRHHPPISALHADGEHFRMDLNVEPEVFFWGLSLEVKSKGSTVIHLKKRNEDYHWPTVPVHVKNMLLGTPYLEYNGSYKVARRDGRMEALVEFKGNSRSGFEGTAVKGTILDNGRQVRVLRGFWADHLMSAAAGSARGSFSSQASLARIRRQDAGRDKTKRKGSKLSEVMRKSVNKAESISYKKLRNEDGRKQSEVEASAECGPGDHDNLRLLFKMRDRPPDAHEYYYMSYFALGLNEIKPGQEGTLCPTDSRFRPDLRAWEDGQEEKAEQLRQRLGTYQLQLNESGEDKDMPRYKQRWFVRKEHPVTGTQMWVYDESTNFWERKYDRLPRLW